MLYPGHCARCRSRTGAAPFSGGYVVGCRQRNTESLFETCTEVEQQVHARTMRNRCGFDTDLCSSAACSHCSCSDSVAWVFG
jgi:hypothetical protein